MHPRIGKFSSEWILNTVSHAVPVISIENDIHEQHFDMPENTGSAIFSRYILPMGLALSHAQSYYKQLIPGKTLPAEPVILDFNENTLFIQNLRSGCNTLHEAVSGDKLTYGFQLDHIRFQKNFILYNNFHMDDQIDLFSISLPYTVLVQMLGKELAAGLIERLELVNPPSGKVIKSVEFANKHLYEAFEKNNQFIGLMHKIFLQTKAMEFISAFAANFLNPTQKVTSSVNNVASDIHDWILASGSELPTLELICSKYNKPARVLNDLFVKKYGISIIKFIIKTRLDQAHEIIKTSELPLKVIADRVGYSHVNNFSNAFSKQFGYPPGKLRKE